MTLYWVGIVGMMVGAVAFLGTIALVGSTPRTNRVAAAGGLLWIVGTLLVLLSVALR